MQGTPETKVTFHTRLEIKIYNIRHQSHSLLLSVENVFFKYISHSNAISMHYCISMSFGELLHTDDCRQIIGGKYLLVGGRGYISA